jgi:hypothetical protein
MAMTKILYTLAKGLLDVVIDRDFKGIVPDFAILSKVYHFTPGSDVNSVPDFPIGLVD